MVSVTVGTTIITVSMAVVEVSQFFGVYESPSCSYDDSFFPDLNRTVNILGQMKNLNFYVQLHKVEIFIAYKFFLFENFNLLSNAVANLILTFSDPSIFSCY